MKLSTHKTTRLPSKTAAAELGGVEGSDGDCLRNNLLTCSCMKLCLYVSLCLWMWMIVVCVCVCACVCLSVCVYECLWNCGLLVCVFVCICMCAPCKCTSTDVWLPPAKVASVLMKAKTCVDRALYTNSEAWW